MGQHAPIHEFLHSSRRRSIPWIVYLNVILLDFSVLKDFPFPNILIKKMSSSNHPTVTSVLHTVQVKLSMSNWEISAYINDVWINIPPVWINMVRKYKSHTFYFTKNGENLIYWNEELHQMKVLYKWCVNKHGPLFSKIQITHFLFYQKRRKPNLLKRRTSPNESII